MRLRIPKERRFTQERKSASLPSEEACAAAIAKKIVDTMEPDTFYLIGAGPTTRAIMRELQLENTLIGVDIVKNKKLVASDTYGSKITGILCGHRAKLIVSATGGQGFLFGRRNQQLTAEVLRMIGKENIIIAATREKLFQLRGRPLLIDTGDSSLDEQLSGYYPVHCSYNEVILSRACLV